MGDEGGTVGQAGLGEELEAVRRALIELDPSLLLMVVLRYFCDFDSTANCRPRRPRSSPGT